jgi:hypothetical protein
MEQPPPPPGLDYNTFRRYRTSLGVRGSVRDVADAWREYKEASREETARTSPVRSQRQSPVRYGGLARASLEGLPLDAGRVVAAHVGRGVVHGLGMASRSTRRMVDAELRRLCYSEVGIDELVRALPHLRLPVSIRVFPPQERGRAAHLTHAPDSSVTMVVVSSRVKGRGYGTLEVAGVATALADINGAREGAREGGVDPAELRVELNPEGLIQVLERRLSCARADPGYASSLRERAVEELVESVQHALNDMLGTSYTVEGVRELLEADTSLRTTAAYTPERLNLRMRLSRLTSRLWRRTSWLLAELVSSVPDLPLTGSRARLSEALDEVVSEQLDRLRKLYRTLVGPSRLRVGDGTLPGSGEE